MLRSSIDLGTNTCLLLIARVDREGSKVIEVLEDQAQVVRLGQGVDEQENLVSEAMDRTINALGHYLSVLRRYGIAPSDTVCVATSQARDARNGKSFFERVRNELGFSFQVLSGNDEAKYSFLGALTDELDREQVLVIDIGGGSTEFVSSKEGLSLDIGSVRFTERYLKSDPVEDSQFLQCMENIDFKIASLKETSIGSEEILVGVAGTVTTLATWHLEMSEFSRSKIDNVVLSKETVFDQVQTLRCLTTEDRQKLVGVEKERADVLLAGAMILWRAMETLNFTHCRVSTRGLRYGILQIEV